MNLRRILALAVACTTGAAGLALHGGTPASASPFDDVARWVAQPAGADLHWSSPAIADVNNDGSNDVVVGGQNGLLYAYNADGSALPGWPARVEPVAGQGAAVASSPAVGDLDGDGSNEVAVGAGTVDQSYRNQNGGVVIFNGNGSVRCRFRTNDKFNVWTEGGPDGFSEPVFNSPAMGDVDGDGSKDVVFGSFDHFIRAIDRNCNVIAAFDNQDTVWSAPAVADVDGDGQAEVFIGGDATRGGLQHDGGYFRRLDYNGSPTFAQPWVRLSSETFQSAPAIGTINGRAAVVTGAGHDKCINLGRCSESNRVWAFDVGNGEDLPGWPQAMPSPIFLTGPALGDVNGDGSTDVVMGSKDGTIRAFRGDGSTIWSTALGDNDYVGSPVIADVNGSGTPEVVAAATPRSFVLGGTNGQILSRFGAGQTGLAHKNAPAVGSLGRSWAVVTAGFDPRTGNTGWVQAFDIPNPTSAPWPLFRKNARRLGADVTDAAPLPPCATGYWLVAGDGGIFSFGLQAPFFGSTGDIRLNQPIVGMTPTPNRQGYQFVARDGGVFSFGNAAFHGSTGAMRLNRPVVGMAATPSGNGYWLVASDGGIFSFGDAQFHGSTGAMALNAPIVGMASTPTGNGYWLVASDGGIFSFGDAEFFGSTGAMRLNKPIVGMSGSPSGRGYWFVASDGGIFSFGDATFFGSTGDIRLNQPVVGMRRTASGNGYWFVAADGGIFSFGDAEFCGSTGNIRLNQPIVGMG